MSEIETLRAKIRTALFEPDSLTRAEADALCVELFALVGSAAAERKAIVRFLRTEYDTDSVRDAAECIARGEHREGRDE